MIAILVLAFVLSGAAGLIYESIWTRYLGLFVGHSAYAQIIVLVIFLGGMSLGAAVVGRRASWFKTPLLWYAGIEFVVGLMAMGFHDVFEGTTAFAYDAIFPSLSGFILVIVKWSLAGSLILPQSILLGATFPLMSAGVIRVARAEAAPGRILSLLYFANSLGAAGGVLLAGFVLLEAAGLPGTLMVAAFVNVLVAIVVGLLARAHQRLHTERPAFDVVRSASDTPETQDVELTTQTAVWRPLLIVAFGTAVASFIYEIAWIRMLSLVVGSATHSFELMLSAFILGLALGALWIRRRSDALEDPVAFLGRVQWAMGLLAVATLPVYVASFDWIAWLLQVIQTNAAGYRVFSTMKYLIALAVMLPATFCAGMTLPLITRVLMRAGAGERAIGAVYAVNTLGSIAGVALAGLVLLPLVGLKLLLITGALVDIGLGVWISWRERRSGAAGRERWGLAPDVQFVTALVATVALIGIVGSASRFKLTTLTSGVYRHGVVASDADYAVPFYRDGRTASVSLRRGRDGFITLATNGKPDASMDSVWMDSTASGAGMLQVTRDLATQLLLPIITLAHAPRAEHAAVIGHGSGMSTHVLLGSTGMQQVVTIEIEPEMIRGALGFLPANRRAYEDDRSVQVIDDAKSYFASTGRKFDLILSEPSNPWVSGVSGLFTLEFYQRVSRKLSPTGVFGQWLHLYELSDGLATAVLAAIDAVFPSYEIFYTSNADILVVASNRELPEPAWNVVAYPGIAADLRRVVPFAPEQLEALRLGGRAVLRPMIQSRGAANSDYFPVLDLGAEKTRFRRENADGYTGLAEGRFDVVAALSGRRADFGRSTLAATPDVPRSEARALGATLHAIRTLGPSVARLVYRNAETRAAVYRLDGLERMAASTQPPADWHRWMEHVVACDAELHSGTAGVVDSAFFARLRAFAARTGAPADVRASLDFLHGIGTWNWPEVVASSAVLESSRDTVGWLPETLLRNGSAVAHIKIGNYSGARDVLRHHGQRSSDDLFRERLISAYLVFAMQARARTDSARNARLKLDSVRAPRLTP